MIDAVDDKTLLEEYAELERGVGYANADAMERLSVRDMVRRAELEAEILRRMERWRQ